MPNNSSLQTWDDKSKVGRTDCRTDIKKTTQRSDCHSFSTQPSGQLRKRLGMNGSNPKPQHISCTSHVCDILSCRTPTVSDRCLKKSLPDTKKRLLLTTFSPTGKDRRRGFFLCTSKLLFRQKIIFLSTRIKA